MKKKMPERLDLYGSFSDAATILKIVVFGITVSWWKTTHPVYPVSCF